MLDDSVKELLERPHELVLWLTGAGISAESGIPTFRGKEGYWRVGSRNYQPEEMATRSAFEAMPEEVWAWYLYRRGVCRGAEPNAAHLALAKAEQRGGDRFLLVTQNVDGLHLRAGNTLERTYQIHGNIDFMRCSEECLPAPVPMPDRVEVTWEKGRALSRHELELLRCPSCGAMARPHVLWFDESYDEPNFRFQSSIEAARHASLVIVVGTTGATTLPMHIGTIAAQRGVPMIVINPEPNPFSSLVERTGVGAFLEGTAGDWVPTLEDALPKA
ncbi:MAG: RNA polymerase subunit sigma [Myxococcales bacterium]|nr:RNA polymerase subunit sigma [Deltaproteobacteria bacterium]NND29720.1 RNA polymerase subunit sigma [Myxococcales bacterium]NNK43586.1 RNA polymerase subunit sigma [Myxococcales bacterium]